MQNSLVITLAVLCVSMGCGDRERLAKLEKDNADLRSELHKNQAARGDYEMQEKCNHDAKEWLRDNWRNTKDTIFMTYNDHYNKENNSCFLVVEHHVKSIFGADGSWSNVVEMWDVLENNKFASMQEDHLVHVKPEYGIGQNVVECEVASKKCTTADEFYNLTKPYMSH